jgi:hypothetical protein
MIDIDSLGPNVVVVIVTIYRRTTSHDKFIMCLVIQDGHFKKGWFESRKTDLEWKLVLQYVRPNDKFDWVVPVQKYDASMSCYIHHRDSKQHW